MNICYSWTEAVKYLKELLDKNTPLAGNGIAVEQTAAGRRISLAGNGEDGGSGKYRGPFKVESCGTKDSMAVKVYDSTNPKATDAGFYRHGISYYHVRRADNITVTDSGIVYMKITWTDNDAAKFEFAFNADLPTSKNGELYIKIAEVKVDKEGISAIRQIQQGDLMTPGAL